MTSNREPWTKIDEGWYMQPRTGAVVQCWYRAHGSPKNKAGWYLWPGNYQDALGPFKTRREAITEAVL